MAHVFISYSRKDTEFVEKLERDLQSKGIVIWRDAHNIPGGEEWYQSIVTGLDDSYAMLCVVTANADQSRWVLREQLYGDQRALLRIPVLPQAHKIPFHLIETQPILCTHVEYESALARLVAILGQAKDTRAPTISKPDDSERNIKAYLDFLLAEAKADLRDALYVNLIGVSEAGKIAQKANLSALSFGLGDAFGGFERLGLEQIQGEAFDKRGEDIPDARTPLRDMQRVVLLGEPGSGKTTTLLQLAVDLAREAQEKGDKFPVFIPLRQFDGKTSFEVFVKAQMYTLQNQYETLLAQDKLILLLDALNEMPRKSADGRELVAEVRDYLSDKQDWIVSCRVRDYQEELSSLDGLGKVRLKALDPPRIYEVIQKQFTQLAQEYPGKVKQNEGENLWAAMHGTADLLKAWQVHVDCGNPDAFWAKTWHKDVKPEGKDYYWDTAGYDDWERMTQDKRRMIPLCRNPYMTNMVCRLYAISKTLPDNRGALFAQFVDKLLDREQQAAESVGAAWLDDSLIRKGLAYIAYEMGAETEMPHKKAEQILQKQLSNIDHTLLLRLAVSASLLDVGDNVRFTHQLLQEYFAGEVLWSEIENNADPSSYWKSDNWWEANGREEALIILAGVHGDPEKVAGWLAPAQPELAIEVIRESGVEISLENITPETRNSIIESAKAKKLSNNPLERATAYRVLDWLNADTRSFIGVKDWLPDIDWVEIPAGEFIYGDDDKEDYPSYAKPGERQEITLPAFEISRYPVTYAQFRAFVDAQDGFSNDEWWEGLAQRRQEVGEQRFKHANHPRENVSWYDALVFCRWLSYRLRCEVRLPTEFEWEKTTRGKIGRKFAYGDEFDVSKSNTSSTGIGKTSAVGIFPDGASPYGVMDMSGNVWEWCLTDWNNPQQEAELENIRYSSSLRVLRGGSWNSPDNDSRTTCRNFFHPSYRSSRNGFRLVRPFPIR